jgi:hypothetical protein
VGSLQRDFSVMRDASKFDLMRKIMSGQAHWTGLTRRRFLAATASLATLPFFGTRGNANSMTGGVVEMFTSQGCSSCPPADAYLEALAARDDVLALGYHVDYWDYLGWTDTLGSAENTARQYAYRKAFGNRSVYTPQAIVNGLHDEVGSRTGAVDQLLAASVALSLAITLEPGPMGGLDIEIAGGKPDQAPAHVHLVYFLRSIDVPVSRGENAGHTITYVNSVRSMSTVGLWTGDDMLIRLPMSDLEKSDADACAVLVQRADGNGHPGAILGAGHYLPS